MRWVWLVAHICDSFAVHTE